MTPNEPHASEPKWHYERWLPDFDVEAFHAANRLAWDKGDGWPAGTKLKKIEAIEEPEHPELPEQPKAFHVIRDKDGKALLGKKFLDATNHWKQNPEANIENKLSIEGKRYLEEVIWVFEKVRKELIDSKGQQLEENPLVSGLPLDEWLATIVNKKIQYEEEFDYIASFVSKIQEVLRKIRDSLLAQEPPKSGLLAKLEALQSTGRSERFSPQKKKGN